MKTFAAFAAALSFALPIFAQQPLQQEITVQHEAAPEPRDVTRPDFLPVISLPKTPQSQLAYSYRTVNVAVAPAVKSLPPVAYADSLYAPSPWRGYVAGGLFPSLFNAGLAAGYKFIDNDRTRLNATLQYQGAVWRGDFPADDAPRTYFRRHSLDFDASLIRSIGAHSSLAVNADFGFARYTVPAASQAVPQMMRRVELGAAFSSTAPRRVDYMAGVNYRHFGFNNSLPIDISGSREAFAPVRENFFDIFGLASMKVGDHSTALLRANLSVIANSRHTTVAYIPSYSDYIFTARGSYSHALLTLRPAYRVAKPNLDLNLGVRVDFTFNSGKVFHIAPDVDVTWRPVKILALFAKGGGGEHQNSLQSLYDVAPYAGPMLGSRNSHLPITLDLGFTLGSHQGTWLKAEVGYARANDWLMPVTSPELITFFKPVDLKGLHWRAAVGARVDYYCSVSAYYEGAQQSYDKCFYEWRDRAKTVVGAEVSFTPVRKLNVTLGYELRSGRKMIDRLTASRVISYSLGNISNLRLGGSWQYDSRLSFFLSLNNILCQSYRHIGLVPGQGFNGLLGASYKF